MTSPAPSQTPPAVQHKQLARTAVSSDQASPAVSLRDRFISGMSQVAATVCVVATNGPAGRAGITISAMSSVSADGERPTLLICLNQSSNTYGALKHNQRFTLNILDSCKHVDVANAFARRTSDALNDKFSIGAWTDTDTGLPALSDASVVFTCRTSSIQEIGTHAVIVAEVEHVNEAAETNALLYHRRAYAGARPLSTA